MRLTSVSVHGFGRLLEVKINLDRKVIAIVGTNESGKTTLLKAMAYLNDGESLSLISRSRASTITDDVEVVTAEFILDQNDQSVVVKFALEDLPKRLWISRLAGGGNVISRVTPEPRKAQNLLRTAWSDVQNFASSRAVEKLKMLRRNDTAEDESETSEDAGLSIAERFSKAIMDLEEIMSAEYPLGEFTEIVEELGVLADEFFDLQFQKAPVSALRLIAEWLSREEPSTGVGDLLWDRSPDFLLFGEDDRDLKSSYPLSDELLTEVPAALSNLANLGGLNLRHLLDAIKTGNAGLRRTLILRANNQFSEKFKQSWNQSDISVSVDMDGVALEVSIQERDDTITIFDERSAGLRVYVALLAFLSEKGTTVPPILLIDEAENHLHSDAQADLVNTFMSQRQAAKVIYTTHSPACLPPDLGTCIRAVIPTEDALVSRIQNNFWADARAGYSPLMLAMGAAASAFSTVRRVVLAEGASERILLPTLIRKANGLDEINYQVAPGLSETPLELYSSLDFEGAKVAYVVDGDRGGDALRSKLLRSGVPDKFIITLGAATLENLLVPEDYLKAIRLLLPECNMGAAIPDLDDKLLGDSAVSWSMILQNWAKIAGLQLPSKVAVANRLIEDELANLSESGRVALVTLHNSVIAVLGE